MNTRLYSHPDELDKIDLIVNSLGETWRSPALADDTVAVKITFREAINADNLSAKKKEIRSLLQ